MVYPHTAIQCNAIHCDAIRAMQFTATHCYTLKHTATHCTALQQENAIDVVFDKVFPGGSSLSSRCTMVCWCVAVCCNVLQ